MPMSDETKRILVSSILVNREKRQRKKLDTKELEASIAVRGLLQPIIVDRQLVLVAGERRLTACKNLGHPDILCRFVEDLDPIEREIIELEENTQRSDLTWQEQVRATRRIHELYCRLTAGWTQEQTGRQLNCTGALVSSHITVAKALEDENPQVMEASGISGAMNILSRAKQRTMGQQLAELLEVTSEMPGFSIEELEDLNLWQISEFQSELTGELPAGAEAVGPYEIIKPQARVMAVAPDVQNLSFLDWAPSYTGPSFNLIHCDFPYGVNLFDGSQGRGAEPQEGYGDTSDVFFELLDCFCKNLPKFASLSCHIMFWYSEKHGQATRETFAAYAPQVKWQDFPLVWLKSDNAGIIADPRHNPRHVYETCLMGSIGDRNVVKSVGDAYHSPSDRSLHPSAKPEPMLKHFMQMLVDGSTRLFDPTCGSGSSLKAADSLGAQAVLGLEIDSKHFETARDGLKHSRLLRLANAKLGDVL